MKKIKNLISNDSKYDDFIARVNPEIDLVNQMIEQYNNTQFPEQLNAIYQQQKKIVHQFSPEFMTHVGYLDEIHNNLYEEIRQEATRLNIKSLREFDALPSPPTTGAAALADLFTNMHQRQINLFLMALYNYRLTGALDNFNHIFPPNDARHQMLESIFAHHSITFLGGDNSQNFLMTSQDGSEFVLKMEDRMKVPKTLEAHLREHVLKDTLMPVSVDRAGLLYDTQKSTPTLITRSLIITEFCTKKNLINHSHLQIDDNHRLQAALNIYQQMAYTLQQMQREGACFPDMKNANWLMDEADRLRITDTKSFLHIDENGALNRALSESKGYQLISSTFMSPFELITNSIVSADSMHAYMLGKNLYQYLTNCPYEYLSKKFDGKNFDFSAPIFQTEEGKALQQLIKDLTKLDATQRIALADAETRLKQIATPQITTNYRAEIKKIITSEVGYTDIEVNNLSPKP